MPDALTDTEGFSQGVCPHCGTQSADGHFCSLCGKIQPAADLDHFAFFGLPRKLQIDESELEKSFYAFSRQFHPDFFMSASSQERQTSMQLSSMLNDAYRILRDRVTRVSYLLTLEGYKEAEKKAPPDLLEEVFELNMQVEELKAAKNMGDDDEVTEARSSLEEALDALRKRLAALDQRLEILAEEWDSALVQNAATDQKKALLDRMSETLSHRSYVSHLVRHIQEEL
jgi:molecular chaperone HscB